MPRMAASNYNSQPGRVHVLTGKAKREFGEALLREHTAAGCRRIARRGSANLANATTPHSASIVPTRRCVTGRPAATLYLRRARWALTKHSWLDCGLFLQNIILAAHVRGLATCPQVSFVRYQTLIADRLGLGSDELVDCGLSLGYAEPQAPVNRLNMPREPLDNVARWHGFDE